MPKKLTPQWLKQNPNATLLYAFPSPTSLQSPQSSTRTTSVSALKTALTTPKAPTLAKLQPMVASTGATYVILGHSERRQYYREDSAVLREKLALALANGLTPIFCVGEVLEERENGTFNDVVKLQLEEALFDLPVADFTKIIIAYEPVWAIGTGKTATPEQAEDMHAHIRAAIAAKYGEEVADNTSILYGGSCKPSNAAELFAKPDIDGGLIGGAALKCADFMGIVNAF